MSGTKGFTRAMGQIAAKLMLLHEMEEDNWATAAAILREVARLAMTASYHCEEQGLEACTTRPSLEPE